MSVDFSLKLPGILVAFLVCCHLLTGCEETDVRLAAEAGLDAVKAVTLSDEAVRSLAREAALVSDAGNSIAPAGNSYGERLQRLVGAHGREGDFRFEYKVYLAPEVNAFAMADGTIRIYSGLMDMMDDDELRFVVGHEMGHVVKEHIRKKLQLAYAGSAVRKGIASQNNVAGVLARSEIGWFTEKLTGAQFSQQEEREADDYGLAFLEKNGYRPAAAVSALRKLATLGDTHSFLASHPAPGVRADRLERALRGEAAADEPRQGIWGKIIVPLQALVAFLFEKARSLLEIFLGNLISGG
ncbi:MAG: hypothetical protein BM485_14470 [Desulfobulbaceae bacterium DB1]|nr:MAG: hypothetical protein BM485_14470 [Desulfobulbaceae bacterium DB1]